MTKRWGWRWCAALVLAAAMSQTTAGAANPGKSYPVNDRFSVTVPNGNRNSLPLISSGTPSLH